MPPTTTTATVTTTATAAEQCDAIIARHSLLDHPFYRAWADGTLPVAALADYAREYGAFINEIAPGWQTAGEPTIARIEVGHADVWQRSFAASLGTTVAAPGVTQVADLVATARELFGERATALGGLYAFEAQQPLTAQSKLSGLQQHYQGLPSRSGEYFRLHQDDYDEPALLADAMNALDSEDRRRAVAACERMSAALYAALTGIHAPYAGAECATN
jgi:pyrroloquinoline-quinone synthase